MTKTALITGATSGIGLSTLKKFIKENYFVIAIGRNETRLNELKETYSNQIRYF